MKLICNTKTLNHAVMNVSRAVSTKTNVSILDGILIVADNNKLTLTGYDLELGITTVIDAQVVEAGSIVINAKLFSDIVKKMPLDEISISTNNKNIMTIKSGMAQFSIVAQSSFEFPKLPSFNSEDQISIDAGILKEMIDQTLFAVAVNEDNPIHTGSLLECQDNNLCLVSLDGVRLALKKTHLDFNGAKSVVIPGKTLNEITKLITNFESVININISNSHIIFKIEDYTVVSRLLEGEFLNYKTAIPQEDTTQVIVNPKDLISVIERTSLIIFDKFKAPIKIAIDDNMMKFSCQTPTGNSYDEITCEISGDIFEIGFNSKMLLEALKVIDKDKVKLLFNGPLSPLKIVPIEGDDFIFLVLPVRLKNDSLSEN